MLCNANLQDRSVFAMWSLKVSWDNGTLNGTLQSYSSLSLFLCMGNVLLKVKLLFEMFLSRGGGGGGV